MAVTEIMLEPEGDFSQEPPAAALAADKTQGTAVLIEGGVDAAWGGVIQDIPRIHTKLYGLAFGQKKGFSQGHVQAETSNALNFVPAQVPVQN